MVTVILLTVSALAVISTGGLARQVGNLVGLGSSAVIVFDIAKWPVMLLIVSLILAILYYMGPNVRQPGIRWVSPGSVLAVIAWLIASVAFAFYVGNSPPTTRPTERLVGWSRSSYGCVSPTW